MNHPKISLTAARVNAGLTQEQVARRMKINKQTIVNWEKGRTRPSVADVAMLCDIYDFPHDYIFLPR